MTRVFAFQGRRSRNRKPRFTSSFFRAPSNVCVFQDRYKYEEDVSEAILVRWHAGHGAVPVHDDDDRDCFRIVEIESPSRFRIKSLGGA